MTDVHSVGAGIVTSQTEFFSQLFNPKNAQHEIKSTLSCVRTFVFSPTQQPWVNLSFALLKVWFTPLKFHVCKALHASVRAQTLLWNKNIYTFWRTSIWFPALKVFSPFRLKRLLFFFVNPFHPNISMHIIHTVRYTFPQVLKRRICLPIKKLHPWWPFVLFSWPQCLIQQWYCREKLDASHSHRLKG